MNTVLILAALTAGQNQLGRLPAWPTEPTRQRAETRKEARDQVLRSAGPEALAFTKHFGDLGIQALAQCEQGTAKRLVELFHSGELLKLGDARLALEAVRQHGQPVAAWLVEHHSRLADRDALDCFATEPLEFVYDLKDVAAAAEARRAARKMALPWGKDGKPGDLLSDWRNLALAAAGLVVIGLLWQRRARPAP